MVTCHLRPHAGLLASLAARSAWSTRGRQPPRPRPSMRADAGQGATARRTPATTARPPAREGQRSPRRPRRPAPYSWSAEDLPVNLPRPPTAGRCGQPPSRGSPRSDRSASAHRVRSTGTEPRRNSKAKPPGGRAARSKTAETWRQERAACCPAATVWPAQPTALTDSTGAPVKNTASSSAARQAAILSVRRRSGLPSRPSLRASLVVLMPGTPFALVRPAGVPGC